MRTPRPSFMLAACCGAVLTCTAVNAQVQWRSGTELAPNATSPRVAAKAVRALVADADSRHVVVRFDRPLTSAERSKLAASGVQLGAFLSNNSYFARVDADRLNVDLLGSIAALEHAGAIEREHKLHPMLAAGEVADWATVGLTAPDADQEPEPIVGAYVMMHRDVNLQKGAALLEALGADVRDTIETINTFTVELPYSVIDVLAAMDEVQWIEPPLPSFSENNNSSRAAVQAGLAQTAPYGLDGTGVVALVYDGGSALSSHGDFGGRLTVRDGSGLSDHATHVSGTVGGSGAGSAGLYAGMAPNVTIESYGFQYDGSGTFLYSNPGDIEADYGQAINTYSADVANNSIGTNTETNGFACSLQGDYGVTSNLIDSIVRGSLGEPIRIMWANGNERQGDRCDVEGFGDYYSIAPPAGAKNHLTIGAMNSNNNSVTSFTSWGPTDDGRLKPDISAPGCQNDDDGTVTSCSSSGGYTGKCGTSMASPAATGCAALLLQDFRAQYPGQPDMLPSTNKVLFVQNATDLQSTGPDFQTGYGMMQVKDTIDFMRGGSFLEGDIGQGGVQTYEVDVAGGTSEMRVTLAWDDFEGTPNVNPALVNDLDLLITGPGGTHFPWTLDPSNPGAAAVRTAADHLNNIEQVVVDNPAAGTYTISITGFSVPEGPQIYSLAASEALPPLIATNITPNTLPELVAPGAATDVTAQISSINETLVPGSAQVFYRYDGGSFVSLAMTNTAGSTWEATLPGPSCSAVVEYYFSAEGDTSGVTTNPATAPAATYTFNVGEVITLFSDNFESDLGWSTTSDPGLTAGAWDRGIPVDCNRGDPPTDADGSGQAYLTENSAANGCNTDVDGGGTTLTSPVLDGSDPESVLAYDRWYSNTFGGEPAADIMVVEVSDNDGGSWTNLETVGPGGSEVSGGWIHKEFLIADIPGISNTNQLRVRFTVSDLAGGSVVEAGVDGVVISKFQCEDVPGDFCAADVTGPGGGPDGNVDALDILMLIAQWGSPCVGSCEADITGTTPLVPDGNVDSLDFLLLISQWGSPGNCP